MTYKLENYLRTYRKRASFSQGEVAFLLGCKSGTKVSRYELFSRTPALSTALALEVIFGVPTSDLFAGIHQRVTSLTVERAQELIRTVGSDAVSSAEVRKLAALRAITRQRP